MGLLLEDVFELSEPTSIEEALVTYETATEIAPNDRVLRRNFTQFKELYDEYVAPPAPPEDEESQADEVAKTAAEESGDDQNDG